VRVAARQRDFLFRSAGFTVHGSPEYRVKAFLRQFEIAFARPLRLLLERVQHIYRVGETDSVDDAKYA
jgi:hypothetical protein